MDKATLFGLVDHVYEAAASLSPPESWRGVLQAIADGLGADGANLYFADSNEFIEDHWISTCLSPDEVASYTGSYAEHDQWNLRALQRPVGQPLISDELIPLREYADTAVFQEFLRPAGFVHGLGTAIVQQQPWTVMLGLLREPTGKSFTAADVHALQPLVQHVAQAFLVGNQLQRQLALEEKAAGVADYLTMGIIYLDHRARVVSVNAKAAEILAGGGIQVRGHELFAESAADTHRLLGMIGSAVVCDPGQDGWGGSLSLPRKAPGALQVFVAPNRSSIAQAEQYGADIACLVFLQDPMQRPQPPMALLGQLYGLTRKELRIAEKLMQGYSPLEIASELFVTRDTVKFHVNKLFRKTHTRRQADLVRVLLAAHPG